MSPSSPPPGDAPVSALLRPRSTAVVGASGRPDSFGRRLLDALAEWRHADALYPVNPRYGEIAGPGGAVAVDALAVPHPAPTDDPA